MIFFLPLRRHYEWKAIQTLTCFGLKDCCCPSLKWFRKVFFSQALWVLQPLNALKKIGNNPVQGWTITQGPPLKTYVYLNKWMDGKKHEHRWAPMNAHEHLTTHELKCIPLIFQWFFQNNAVSKLYFQFLFLKLLIYHLGCLAVRVFKSKHFIKKSEKWWYVFFIQCWFGNQKNYPLPLLQHMFI